MEDWERDIFLAVRRESFYFYPVFACQIMNEGWASYWHARLLREADFLPPDQYLDAAKTHSDVVRPHAGDKQIALAVNPYHLGFTLWEKIIEAHGVDHARRIMMEDDDFSFIRNCLTEDIARELRLFNFNARKEGEIKVAAFDIHALRESILGPKFNFGAASVLALPLPLPLRRISSTPFWKTRPAPGITFSTCPVTAWTGAGSGRMCRASDVSADFEISIFCPCMEPERSMTSMRATV